MFSSPSAVRSPRPNSTPGTQPQTHFNLQPSPSFISPSSPTLLPPPIPDPNYPPPIDNRPVQVILVVYDLLPSGKLSDLAWLLGVGLYHTAVKIPAIGREIAFGGHAHPQTSGIFMLPIREDGEPSMPGLRWICEIDMGFVKTGDQFSTVDHPLRSQLSFASSLNFASAEDEESRRLIRPPPSAAKLINKYHSPGSPHHSAYPPTSMPELPSSPIHPIDQHYRSYASSSTSSDSHKSSSPPAPAPPLPASAYTPTTTNPKPAAPSSALTQIETLALILDQLEHSPDWHGTSYDLLKRNCNTFSDQLCILLTGKGAPKWINRAAAVGSSFPCLVPAEWIDPPIAPPPTDEFGNYEEEEEEEEEERTDRQVPGYTSTRTRGATIPSPTL
ncbi:hypothetical protein PGTUg99_013236 [Puccinia graminis f. sp. tritici]|uniref:PPPDE domain-containing protein n=1 Tax=Puccinia graminis f. sp. tritici TaxID=56615 RepID=A0A5B0MS61_PUCGR|nr:hypothetical protein PGTUg99_013236 [Puccinia graminis f. sp. tritici]